MMIIEESDASSLIRIPKRGTEMYPVFLFLGNTNR
jgi:hypothetical protein